jgi:outer membrane protein OmpA-like peptidoglycan-associated protein
MRVSRERRRSAFAMLAASLFAMVAVGSSWAQDEPTEAQIFEALKPQGGTRALTRSREERQRNDDDRRFIAELRARPARTLTAAERTRVAEIAKGRPTVDIEINFDFDKDTLRPGANRPIVALGRALSREELKGLVFLINGHTDARGDAEYNLDLSERRAEAVKRVLMKEFDLPADSLIAVGHGKTQLKNTANPLAAENRRVQIVNTGYVSTVQTH